MSAATLRGRCHCGAIRFSVPRQAAQATVCHCADCRGQSGAPMLAWAMLPTDRLSVRGEPKVYASSADGRRSFCGACGTGLFFSNAALRRMGMTQLRIAALEEPELVPPRMQVQVAERIGWLPGLPELPEFQRFPGP